MRNAAARQVWVLEFSVKGPQEPVYPMMGAVVFSTPERALAWIAGHGVRVRWDAGPTPDYRTGFTRGGDLWWKWILARETVDGAPSDDS